MLNWINVDDAVNLQQETAYLLLVGQAGASLLRVKELIPVLKISFRCCKL